MTPKIIYSIIILVALFYTFIEGIDNGKQKAWIDCHEAYKSKCAINENMSRLMKGVGK
jgi:hypothetical protein